MDSQGQSFLHDNLRESSPARVLCEQENTPADGRELVFRGTSGCRSGEADIYAHTIGLEEWDTCAPETVARALGWHVSKLRGEEHVYNQKNPKNHELLVCRPAWKESLLVALKESGALEPGAREEVARRGLRRAGGEALPRRLRQEEAEKEEKSQAGAWRSRGEGE